MGKITMKFDLKKVRESRGISQNELARRCGLAVGTIQNYERGLKKQYSHELLEQFCEVLECEPSELFTTSK